MKILICEFRQESNSFNPVVSDMEFWKKSGIHRGKEIYNLYNKSSTAIGGMISGIDEFAPTAEIVYGTAMSCQSGGPVQWEVVECFLQDMTNCIEQNAPIDILLFSFHGALASTRYDDVEGEILRRLRKVAGDRTVFAAATDLHGCISQEMLEELSVICAYHTYPHVDYADTGYRTAKFAVECQKNDKPIYTAYAMVPMIVPASAYNTMSGCFCKLMERAKAEVDGTDILDFAIYQMQPWLDVSYGGSSVLAMSHNKDSAKEFAKKFAERLWEHRGDFVAGEHSIDEVVSIAQHLAQGEKPIVLVDAADSCNAGACGDSMAVAEHILRVGSKVRAAMVVNDLQAATLAHKIGVGGKQVFRLGGQKSPEMGYIEAECYVKSLHDGVFVQEGPAGRGVVQDIGRAAVLQIGNIDVVVCNWMAGNGDPQLFRAFGIEPSFYQLLVVKACTSFRAAYEKIASAIYPTDTPGVACSNLQSLNYKKIPKTFWPWNSLNDYKVVVEVYSGRTNDK